MEYFRWHAKADETTRTYDAAILGDRLVDVVERSPACKMPCAEALDRMGDLYDRYTTDELIPLIDELIPLAEGDACLPPDEREEIVRDLRDIQAELRRLRQTS